MTESIPERTIDRSAKHGEKVANEASLIGRGGISAVKIIMWAEDNGAWLSDVIRREAAYRRALEQIAHPPFGLGFNKLRGIARKALIAEAASPTGGQLGPGTDPK